MVNQPHHFIGIGGIGMSALARILLDRKVSISGSDLVLTPNTEQLIHEGARVHIGHSPDAVPKGAKVVYSTSVAKTNPEIASALQQKLPILHRADLLAELMRGYKTLCVTGTHGKTTTSALLAHVLDKAKQDPSYAIGGILKNQMTNGKAGRGDFFVAEADESDGSFLKYPCFGAILTNIGHEHLDHFGSFNALVGAFASFISHVSSSDYLFYCADDTHLCSLANTIGTSYGFSEHAALRITRFCQKGWSIEFDLTFEEKCYSNLTLPLVGKHNALNAAAVFGLALRLGLSLSEITQAFASFEGVARRQDVKGEVNSIMVIDDYAHHPKEIQATLLAFVRALRERRHVVIFQPHRFSRTQTHFDALAHAFEGADLLFIADLYAAGEEPIDGVSSQDLIRHIREHTDLPVFHLPKEKAFAILHPHLRPHDVITTLGAGDITSFATTLMTKLGGCTLNKWQVGVVEGGRSAEYEISLRSSACVKEALNPKYYTQKVFRIDKGGNWHFDNHSGPISDSVILRAMESCDLFFLFYMALMAKMVCYKDFLNC